MRTRPIGLALAASASIAALSSACSGGKGTPSPTPSPTPLPGACAADMPVDTIVDSAATAVIASGDGSQLGQEDASIVYPLAATTGWMTYTSATFVSSGLVSLTTHAARSTDHGASWTHVVALNATTPATVYDTSEASLCPGGTAPCSLTGDLMHETSSLIDDSTDPDASKRWKVFVHTYLELPPASPGGANRFQFEIGYTGYLTAPDPAGPWSPETKLFGWNGPTALSSSNAVVNLSNTAGMTDCSFAGEPGALVTADGIDVAMSCIRLFASPPTQDIELMRSTDHGAHWSHVSRILPATWSSSMCGAPDAFSGSDLFTSGGKEYLTVVTGGNVLNEPGGYNACLVFEVADPVAGTLATDASGRPPVLRRILGPGNRHSGPCTYADGASALGYVLTEEYWDGPPLLRNLATGPIAVP